MRLGLVVWAWDARPLPLERSGSVDPTPGSFAGSVVVLLRCAPSSPVAEASCEKFATNLHQSVLTGTRSRYTNKSRTEVGSSLVADGRRKGVRYAQGMCCLGGDQPPLAFMRWWLS